MSTLYFVRCTDQIVYTYSYARDDTWQFSRLSPHQVAKGIEKFVLLYVPRNGSKGWVVQDQSPGAKDEIIGEPKGELADNQTKDFPPLGSWSIWGWSFKLTTQFPNKSKLDLPPSLSLPFATMHYRENGNIAWLYVQMTSTPIVDDVFEDMLDKFKQILRNLSQRPEMVLLMRSDARESAVPAYKHIRRFLTFVDDNGPEFVLVGRGNAIVLPKSFLGATLQNILKLIQKVFPSPWPEQVVSTLEDADKWLAKVETEAKAELAARGELCSDTSNDAKATTDQPNEHKEKLEPNVNAGASETVPAPKACALIGDSEEVLAVIRSQPASHRPRNQSIGAAQDTDSREEPSDIVDPSIAPTSVHAKGSSWFDGFCTACTCGR